MTVTREGAPDLFAGHPFGFENYLNPVDILDDYAALTFLCGSAKTVGCRFYPEALAIMGFKDVAIIILACLALVLAVWLGNRFRRFVSAKITNNWKITERQFWLAAVSTKEQATEIVHRVSHDIIAFFSLQLALTGCLVLSSGSGVFDLLPLAVACALWIGLAAWVGTTSYVAALILAVLTTLPAIVMFVVAIYNTVNSGQITPILSIAVPLCIPLATSWMAWRALVAIRKLREAQGVDNSRTASMPNRATRFNGWHRIGIVLSVMWTVGSTGSLAWNEINWVARQQNASLSSHDECRFPHYTDECPKISDAAFVYARDEAIKESCLLIPVLALIPIIGFWLLAYVVLYVIAWIRAGFKPRAL